MFNYGLGASFSSIARYLLGRDLIESLRNSKVSTFELHVDFFTYDYDGALRAELRRMLEETGKRVISFHVPFAPWDDLSSSGEETRLRAVSLFRAHYAVAEEFNCRYIVLHPSQELHDVDPSAREMRITALRRSLKEVEAELKAKKIQLAMEFLPRHCLGNTLQEMLRIIEGFDPETVGVCFDVNHIMGQYAQIPVIVRALGKRLFTLHLSDYDGVDERHWLPGRGVIDWPAFIQALKDIDYQGPFNYEILAQEGTFDFQLRTMEENYNWLRSL